MVSFSGVIIIDLWQISIENELYKGFTQNLIDNNNRKVNVHIVFANSCLKTILLSFFLPSEKTERFRESNYPNADMQRYYLHDAILRETLGDPPYNFKWGFISLGSGIDWFSAIVIDYFGDFF